MKDKKLKLMTHVIVGYPDLEQTKKIVRVMERSGVDFIELQIPFSDPLADGPTIMRACEMALEGGVRVKDAFKLAKELTSEMATPILFMAYFNTVYKYGVERFCKDAQKAGAYGLIVPDIPLEEEGNEGFDKYCKKYKLANIRVLSPASNIERIKKNSKIGSGFVYCTARQGITGAQKGLNPATVKYLRQVRDNFNLPIAVGFGISKKEYVDLVRPYADIVVVGSAIIDLIGNSKKVELERNIQKFIGALGV